MRTQPLSLFEMAREAASDQLSVLTCTKATLVQISHLLEDVVLRERLPALMFTGFQESSHWTQETRRYAELVEVAQQVCIFAGKPLPDDAPARAIQIELSGDDPLRQEWFVAILSPEFSVILAGIDNLVPVSDEGLREFETLLTFNPIIINAILDRLEAVLGHYRPDLVPSLQQARRTFDLSRPNIRLLDAVIQSMVHFEEALNSRLRDANTSKAVMLNHLMRERDLNTKLIQASPALYATINQTGQIITANPAMTQLFGDTASIRGSTIWELAPADDAHVYREALIALQNGEHPNFQAQAQTRDGEMRTINWVGQVIERMGNQPQTFFLMGQDVSAQLEATVLRMEEERLQLALRFERNAKEMLTRFMSTIAHEFRTPLATILTSTELMERHYTTMLPEARDRRISRIKEQVNLLASMMNDISTVLQANDGRFSYSPNPTDVVRFCRNLVDTIHVAHPSEHTLVFEHSWQDDTVWADTRLLTHILSNLLINAINYTPPGTVIALALYREGDTMIFEVCDQGDGIPISDQAHLYEAFYRGANATEVSGTGLGLKIVADCVAIYEGRIHFTTSTAGTTFIVRLPIRR